MSQVYIQYDPNGDGTFEVVISDEEPVIESPKQQLIYPDGTNTTDMILDLTQDPPVLTPITQ